MLFIINVLCEYLTFIHFYFQVFTIFYMNKDNKQFVYQ
jgi:hypothetical protein